MRYRGLTTVCVLTCGLVLAMASSARAQDTKPTPAAAPAEPTLVPVPGDKAPGAVPAAPQTPGAPAGGSANAPKPTTDANSPGDNSKPAMEMWPFVILLAAFVLMMMWTGRGKRKEQAKRKEMLANLKKGDKIVTIGGIIGTVIEVKPDEVTVKVDETNNVRMKFTRGAIHGVGNEARTNLDEDKK